MTRKLFCSVSYWLGLQLSGGSTSWNIWDDSPTKLAVAIDCQWGAQRGLSTEMSWWFLTLTSTLEWARQVPRRLIPNSKDGCYWYFIVQYQKLHMIILPHFLGQNKLQGLSRFKGQEIDFVSPWGGVTENL